VSGAVPGRGSTIGAAALRVVRAGDAPAVTGVAPRSPSRPSDHAQLPLFDPHLPGTPVGRIIWAGALLYTSHMRIPGLSRRWLIAGAISLGVVLGVTLGLAVVYPRVGAWMFRSKGGG
jgi:hypothetical protein